MTVRSDQRERVPNTAGHPTIYVAVAVASLLLALGLWLTSTDRALPEFADPGIRLSSSALDSASELWSQPGRRVEQIDEQAAATLAGYYAAIGSSDDSGWRIDFAEVGPVAPMAIERAMAGAYERGESVERTSEFAISGIGAAPTLPLDGSTDERIAALAAAVEVSGDVDGRLALVPDDRATTMLALAESVGLEPSIVAGAGSDELRLDRVRDRAAVAGWAYTCLDRVPLLGDRGCDGPGQRLAYVDESIASVPGSPIDDWTAGTTGPLDRREPHWLTAEQGAVGWTNGEAQQYRDSAISRTDEGLTITAGPHPEPRVDRAPFDSGLLISQERFGWGRLEVDVRLPVGSGLWPAVWLLDSEACSAPGTCEGYETTQYHEIDLIETAGDTEVATSVHWFDERIRSISTFEDRPMIGDGALHTIALDRRPGLLVWTLDGIEIDRVAGPAMAESGPHRSAPMRLIVNLAVGGSFAGDRLLGPTSEWWGSSKVPNAFPDLGWTTASMTIADARFTSLDDLTLG